MTTGAGVKTRYQYNADGIREAQAAGLETTQYIVDSNRAYAQVIEERLNNATSVSYVYGDDLLSQIRNGTTSIYHYDGLGSTRALSDSSGAITDTYAYEAFGEVLAQSGTTINDYLFAGEQFDQNLGVYYLRARYYDQGIGRFTQMDSWMGNSSDPVTLHKYLYGNANPIMFTDPTGNFGLAEVSVVNNIVGVLANMQVDNGFNILDSFGVDTSSARNANLLLGIASMGGKAAFSMMRMLSSKFRRACNSFDGSTLVSTEFGLREIQNIKIGEYVWAYNEKTGEKSLQEVVHLIRGEGLKDLVDIQLASGDVITATAGHPLYTPEKPEDQKWTDAGQLTIDDVLQGITQSDVRITNLYEHKELATVYNLTVANDHTYYVGFSGVLSHNKNRCKPITGINMRHILSGDIYGGGHSIHGNTAKLVGSRKNFQKSGVYLQDIVDKASGRILEKTFSPIHGLLAQYVIKLTWHI